MWSDSMQGRRVLVTGGASGTGEALVRELHRRDAVVVVGTRDDDRYAALAGALGHTRVEPFIVDITDDDAVRRQLTRLLAHESPVTDLVHCAAGGLDPIMRRLLRTFMRLRRLPSSERHAEMERLDVDLQSWMDETREFALRVNFEAARTLTECVVPYLPADGTVVFYSSLWSSFHGRGCTPAFYRSVAESKLAFERWLIEKAPAWASRQIAATIISGHVIRDTQLGEVIDKYVVPLLPDGSQERIRSFFIDKAAMVAATMRTLTARETGSSRGSAHHLYVFGRDQVVEHLPLDALEVVLRMPLSRAVRDDSRC